MWTGGGSGKKKKKPDWMNYGLKEHGFSAHLMKLDGENLSLKLLLTQGTHATGWDWFG